MQFSDTSNNQGLYQDAQFLAGVDTNAFPVKDFTRLANRWLHRATTEIWKYSDDWEYDDANNSNFPIATTDMVNSQPDYSLPTGAYAVSRVEVKDAAGNWSVVQPIDETQIPIALDELYEIDGIPRLYRMVRNSIVLYPAPDTSQVTATAGLKIYFAREASEFAYTDTTKEPGFAEQFHRICSIGAAFDFCVAKSKGNIQGLKVMLDELFEQMRNFYSMRHEDVRTKLSPRRENLA